MIQKYKQENVELQFCRIYSFWYLANPFDLIDPERLLVFDLGATHIAGSEDTLVDISSPPFRFPGVTLVQDKWEGEKL